MQLFDPKVDKELIQEWTGISRQLGSSSQKNTAELTERVSDVLGGLPPPVRHRQERSTVEKVSWDRRKALCQSGATTRRCPRVFTNDIFAHCSLIFYYLDFKFSNFVCPSELHPLIWFFFKFLQEKEKYPKNLPKCLSS